MTRSVGSANAAIRSLPERACLTLSPVLPNTSLIWPSSSLRSVTISIRASGRRSLIQRASITIIRLLPDPWVCQMIPPSRVATRSCAAFTAKYWFGRAIFFIPASNRVKSWISSKNRAGSIIWVTSRSSGPVISLSSFHASQYG